VSLAVDLEPELAGVLVVVTDLVASAFGTGTFILVSAPTLFTPLAGLATTSSSRSSAVEESLSSLPATTPDAIRILLGTAFLLCSSELSRAVTGLRSAAPATAATAEKFLRAGDGGDAGRRCDLPHPVHSTGALPGSLFARFSTKVELKRRPARRAPCILAAESTLSPAG
jgi:hypothetical protein